MTIREQLKNLQDKQDKILDILRDHSASLGRLEAHVEAQNGRLKNVEQAQNGDKRMKWIERIAIGVMLAILAAIFSL